MVQDFADVLTPSDKRPADTECVNHADVGPPPPTAELLAELDVRAPRNLVESLDQPVAGREPLLDVLDLRPRGHDRGETRDLGSAEDESAGKGEEYQYKADVRTSTRRTARQMHPQP